MQKIIKMSLVAAVAITSVGLPLYKKKPKRSEKFQLRHWNSGKVKNANY